MNDQLFDLIYPEHQRCGNCPTQTQIASFFEHLLGTLFPNFSRKPASSKEILLQKLNSSQSDLKQLTPLSDEAIDHFMNKTLVEVYGVLQGDIDAIYQGDPAAKSREEVIRSYPGFYAMAAYRIAHELLMLKVPILPRSITEVAHGKTGIDIHPAAKIGKQFCIDHGTGVVIGETTVIGDGVKVYQGVTLGALSVDKKLADVKRHPTIEDHVIIYAGATILGGNTTVGTGSIVGGNVWITNSIPPNSRVYYKGS